MPVILAFLVLLAILWVLPGRARRIARGMTMFLLCAILIPALLFVDSAAWTLRFTLLTPGFYLKGLRDVGMYQALPAALAKIAPGAPAGPQPGPGDQTADPVIALASKAVSPEWLERELSRAVEGIVGYIRGSKPTIDLRFDLREPKAKAAELLATEDSWQAMELLQSLDRIPDEVTTETLFPEAQLEQALAQFRAWSQMLAMAGPVLLGVAAVLSLIAWLVGGRDRGARVWLGAGLVTVGSLVVVLGLVALPMLIQFTSGMNISPQFSALPLRPWLETSCIRLLRLWQITGASALALGTVLIAVRRLPWQKGTPGGAGTSA